mmetsp:Transcript_33121/g.46238  ORF Transcript_33121/g.46238 Transcript_33121/m.46238 type:complete len:90 (-) Transcript_33121:12-281(-)
MSHHNSHHDIHCRGNPPQKHQSLHTCSLDDKGHEMSMKWEDEVTSLIAAQRHRALKKITDFEWTAVTADENENCNSCNTCQYSSQRNQH